jgi:hypothetical protein
MSEIPKQRQFSSSSHHDRNYILFNSNLFADKHMGHVDANSEWNDEDKSSRLFVHTKSFDTFKEKSNLFLFGRRGTGKTAIIKMLNHQINEGHYKNIYTLAKIINQEDNFYKLTLELRSSSQDYSYNELVHILKDKWLWIIYTSAMINIIEENQKNAKTDPNLKVIFDYLSKNQLLKSSDIIIPSSPISKAIDAFSKNLENANNTSVKVGVAILRAMKELKSTEYVEALQKAINYLTKNKQVCLLLIDSQELYDFKDDISRAAMSGLMDAVLEVFNNSFQYCIYAKAAFPSEIFPYLNPSNEGKARDKMHFIMWSYKDITKLLAKRYCELLRKEFPDDFLNQECDVVDVAEDFLYKFFPRKIRSYCNIELATFPYIVSHTQQKPREIIQLMNLILTLAEKNKISFKNITSNCVREGTNAKLEDLSSSVLDMYKHIYPNAKEIVKKTFFETRNIFDLGDLHKQLLEALPLLGSSGMSRTDAERLFLETGIVGIVKEENIIKGGEHQSYIEALFEYQIKDTLTVQNKHQLVIHPMFYQGLNIDVDRNSLVYPKPADEEGMLD